MWGRTDESSRVASLSRLCGQQFRASMHDAHDVFDFCCTFHFFHPCEPRTVRNHLHDASPTSGNAKPSAISSFCYIMSVYFLVYNFIFVYFVFLCFFSSQILSGGNTRPLRRSSSSCERRTSSELAVPFYVTNY